MDVVWSGGGWRGDLLTSDATRAPAASADTPRRPLPDPARKMAPTFPQQFGKYVLLRRIATGGMAEIFQAKTAGAEGFEKDIVIKRILPHFSEDQAFVRMFIDEASITAKLQHANIVQIFDFDVINGSYYIAMEYIEGEDLSSVLKDGQDAHHPLSVAQCVWVTMELAKGLHYAHVKEHKGRPLNIIHRDISPHNAMISYNGEVKLMDFGIAKAAERSAKTQAGTVKGKVAYMSPEQARGKNLDGRSDLFALATVLWEMLTLKRAFLRESDFETLTAVLKDPIDRPSRFRPGVDQELDDIILTALEKDRDNRQKSVEEFNRELTRWYYKTVTDFESEKLKPFMRELYAAKIDRIRAEQADVDPSYAQRGGRAPAPPERAQKTGLVHHAEPSRRHLGTRGSRQVEAHPMESRMVPRSEPSEPAMTIEEPVPEILRAAAPRRAQSGAHAALPETTSSRRKGKQPQKSVEDFFSSPQTMLEEDGPSQAEVLAALEAERRRQGSDVPDLTLDGRIKGLEQPRSKTGLILILAFVMLVLGGIIAFLVAP
ncbi:MAG: serine/threonine protein kinase [Deltaproteobacteria bacterium]|nr:MAG: serine/threonine protein kinase [Deltaproteobacteria bacterium]